MRRPEVSTYRNALLEYLFQLNFGPKWIQAIHAIIAAPKYSVLINGSPHGYFSSSVGIKQGDAVSPYLFTIVMEVFSVLLSQAFEQDKIQSDSRQGEPCITHLLFADDLLIFRKSSIISAFGIRDILEAFKLCTGLGPNLEKSTVIFSGGNTSSLKSDISNILSMPEDNLPIKYLGLPLIRSRLSPHHCTPILEKIHKRLKGWATKRISYGGRCELINSTLNSLHVYWSAIFELPSSIILHIKKSCRKFLWGVSSLVKKRSPISWNHVCRPKQEGGLVIRRVKDWNRAATSQLCFQIISKKPSLWTEWVRWKYLKCGKFWFAKPPAKCSWAWRGILRVSESMKGHIFHCIGNGKNTNVWFDPWLPKGPLVDQFGSSIIAQLGRGWNITVDKFIENNRRSLWPATSPDLMLIWKEIENQSFCTDREDDIMWKPSASGLFTMKSAWNVLRHPNPRWDPSKIICDKHNIPKAAFCSWLAI